MEHLQNNDYFEGNVKLQRKFENAVLLFDQYDPDDVTLIHDSNKRKEVIDTYNVYTKPLEEKTKNDEPATLKDFMLVMNSFAGHFMGGLAALGYKEMCHYKQSVSEHPEFQELVSEIEGFINDKDFNKVALAEDIFKNEEDIDWRYKKLYEAYLIMRQYTERGDIDLYD
ncbi:hypothetical protein KC866_03260 [Patescibacteria group bacterium]|nr:hypothetical protein [Patescibacteria group bacterium]